MLLLDEIRKLSCAEYLFKSLSTVQTELTQREAKFRKKEISFIQNERKLKEIYSSRSWKFVKYITTPRHIIEKPSRNIFSRFRQCWNEHGLKYTVKLAFKKVFHRGK